VSGGADSMALALLAHGWARARGGDLLALVVDHGLRADSGAEAALTVRRLAARGIAARLLRLEGLARGTGLAARARRARYAALAAACAEAGRVHLLLGHHAGDQAETRLMREGGGSGAAGLAAMPALSETAALRLLRPLLTVPPERLRATLRAAGVGWVEDPSNTDPATLRARLRAALADPHGAAPAGRRALCSAAAAAGRARAWTERETAAALARHATLSPLGYALLAPGALPTPALGALLRMLGGADWAPTPSSVARLAATPRAATLGGVRLLPAGRLRPGGWLLVREAAAIAPPVPAVPGATWDGRFRLLGTTLPAGLTIGAVGDEAARLRRRSDLPAVILRTLPALWRAGTLVAVPGLGYSDSSWAIACRFALFPRLPAAAAPFVPADLCGCDTMAARGCALAPDTLC
jgi:tRNA(Ile)-lysidine synthase